MPIVQDERIREFLRKGRNVRKNKKGQPINQLSYFYDFFAPTEEGKFRRYQISLAKLREGEKVLEVGCGTGVLSVLAKRRVREKGIVEGIDIAPKMVRKACEKAKKGNLEIGFRTASIDQLPYRDEFFDVVISGFMFHHLPVSVKARGLREVYRVLKRDGRFLLSDFCSPRNYAVPIMYSFHLWKAATRFQLFGRLPGLLEESGFAQVRMVKKGHFLENYLMTK